MKNLRNYINEGLLNRKITTKAPIRYKPQAYDELKYIIIDLLKKGQTNLNCIDVSGITDMRFIFHDINNIVKVKEIDISEWDVSNVTNMGSMFSECEQFNADLSKWNVSNVDNMRSMFNGCKKFNSDLSKWDVSSVTNMNWMFDYCVTLVKNNKIPDWYKGSL